MKGMVLRKCARVEGNPLELSELPDPEPGPDEILIRVHACGICHTDLHIIEAEIETQIARVLKEVTGWERCRLTLEPIDASAEAVLFPESCDLEALRARLAWACEE